MSYKVSDFLDFQNKNTTKIIYLVNLASANFYEDELSSEVYEECMKFGTVLKCFDYKMSELPEEESLRIFVEFESLEPALEACKKMDNRYFGGRVIRARFYDEKIYNQGIYDK